MVISRQPSSELSVITRTKQLVNYVMQVTQKSPKVYRFTFVTRLQNLSLDVLENLFRANEVFVLKGDELLLTQRVNLQRQALINLKLLVYIAEIAMEQKCLLMKQYEQIAKQAFDIQNLIGAWMKSDKKRFGS